MDKEQLIELLTMHIMQYEYDLKYKPELMAEKRTNEGLAKQCINNYELIIEVLEDLE